MAVSDKQREYMRSLTTPVSSTSIPKKVNLFLYGEPGCWKTTTACQVGMEKGRVLHYAINGDHTSYRSRKSLSHVADNTDVIEHKETRQLKILAEMILNGEYPDHSTFVLDTIDSWVNLFINDLVTLVKYSGGSDQSKSRTIIQPKTGNGISGASKFIDEMNLTLTEQADYNMARLMLQPIINDLCNSKMNIVINCHARQAEKDKMGPDITKYVRPNLPEQAYLNTVGECDAMGFLKKKSSGVVEISFDGGSAIATKSRIEELEDKKFNQAGFIRVINEYLRD